METAVKHITDYLKYRLSMVVGGRRDYESWKEKNYELRTIKLKDKKLAVELEIACRKDGFLTFTEFLDIDQFGKYGFHATHSHHGITSTHNNWGKAIFALCAKNETSHVLEFGPGAGSLAIEILKEAKNKGREIFWSGVELNPELRKTIKLNFKKHKFEKQLVEVVANVKELKTKKKSIVVFSYSLDSVPPEMFINILKEKASPNALVGVTIKKGVLREIVLTSDMLEKKGLKLKNGIFTDKNKIEFNISSWLLHPKQRAFISLLALSIFAEFVKRFPASLFVVIDEFRFQSFPWETNHLCMPHDLDKYRRNIDKIDDLYINTGKNLLYFPMYYTSFYKFLDALKLSRIDDGIEQKMAKALLGEPWVGITERYLTHAIIAKNKKRSMKIFSTLNFPKLK